MFGFDQLLDNSNSLWDSLKHKNFFFFLYVWVQIDFMKVSISLNISQAENDGCVSHGRLYDQQQPRSVTFQLTRARQSG